MSRWRVTAGFGMIVLASALVLTGCQGMLDGESPSGRVMLFNGVDLSGWDTFLADEMADPADVWSVRDGVLHCTGQPNGYIRTTDKYEDYRLHLEWRWPDEPTNSGVLLHAQGPDEVWPRCIECQLKAGNAGDFVLMGGAGLTVNGVDRQNPAKRFVVINKMAPTTEVPAGQWNTYEIECREGTIRCFVNGVLQNVGTDATVTSGWICLQSEGGPIEFRNIYLTPVE